MNEWSFVWPYLDVSDSYHYVRHQFRMIEKCDLNDSTFISSQMMVGTGFQSKNQFFTVAFRVSSKPVPAHQPCRADGPAVLSRYLWRPSWEFKIFCSSGSIWTFWHLNYRGCIFFHLTFKSLDVNRDLEFQALLTSWCRFHYLKDTKVGLVRVGLYLSWG